ncbi:hypothetical protein RJ55_01821 [Drechmeria coniospora]|nr:hypothetical protein RJ55_01821 [Drechmeria coniospora]
MAAEEEHEGASVQEQLVEACRRNNVDLLREILADRPDAEITRLLNATTTVLGTHLYHEAASHGHYEVIDFLLDQPDFECDPITRIERDTPLHTVIRWLNAEPPAQQPFGIALIQMMLEAGSNTRVRNKARLTPLQLVDPANKPLRDLIEKHEYASQNAGDFIEPHDAPKKAATNLFDVGGRDAPDDDAEFSGSDEEERAEWERRRRGKKGRA